MRHLFILLSILLLSSCVGLDDTEYDTVVQESGEDNCFYQGYGYMGDSRDCLYECPDLPFSVGLYIQRWEECPLSVCVTSVPTGGWDWCPE